MDLGLLALDSLSAFSGLADLVGFSTLAIFFAGVITSVGSDFLGFSILVGLLGRSGFSGAFRVLFGVVAFPTFVIRLGDPATGVALGSTVTGTHVNGSATDSSAKSPIG